MVHRKREDFNRVSDDNRETVASQELNCNICGGLHYNYTQNDYFKT